MQSACVSSRCARALTFITRNGLLKKRNGKHRFGLLASVLTACIAPTVQAAAAEDFAKVLADAPSHHRFIITYRDGANESIGPMAVANSLSEAAASLPAKRGRRLKLGKLRTLATGSEVVAANRPLDNVEAEALMRRLAADPAVASVEVDQLLQPQLTPNDVAFGKQWAFGTTPAGINVRPAWDQATGKGIVVAVVDSGITSHPDLDAQMLPGYDFVSDSVHARDGDGRDANPTDEGDWRSAGECPNPRPQDSLWHGTHVAGTVAAVTHNAIGVAGTAFEAKVVPVRVLAKCGGWTSDIVDGIVWAAGGTVAGAPRNEHPAEIINLSLGGDGPCSASYQRAIAIATERGATVVVAAGNESTDASWSTPANCANVVTVAATHSRGGRAGLSNYGEAIEVSAPGEGIISTLNSGTTVPAQPDYGFMTGTSMATPHVAGVVALMQSVAPQPLTPATVRNILQRTTRPLPRACPEGCGAGIVDAAAAVAAARNGVPGQGKP